MLEIYTKIWYFLSIQHLKPDLCEGKHVSGQRPFIIYIHPQSQQKIQHQIFGTPVYKVTNT